MNESIPNFNQLLLGFSTYERTAQGYHYHKAYHPSLWEMWVVAHGATTIGVPKGKLTLRKHQGILIPPKVPHERWVDAPEGCVALVTHFKINWPMLNDVALRVLDLSPRALWHIRDFLNVRGDAPLDGIRRRQFWSLLLLELVSPASEEVPRPGPLQTLGQGLHHELVAKVLEQMHNDLSSSLNLEQLEKTTGYGRRRLREVFHSMTGVSLREALMRLRLEEAKRLLLYSPLKVSAIAAMVGFKHARRFNEVFKQRVGCTPTEFAKIGRAPESGYMFKTSIHGKPGVHEVPIEDHTQDDTKDEHPFSQPGKDVLERFESSESSPDRCQDPRTSGCSGPMTE